MNEIFKLALYVSGVAYALLRTGDPADKAEAKAFLALVRDILSRPTVKITMGKPADAPDAAPVSVKGKQ